MGDRKRSKGSYAREAAGVRVVVLSPDVAGRLLRVVTAARTAAAGGRNPQVLEDVNVIVARLLEPESSADASSSTGARNLDVGELLSVAQTARVMRSSPQWIRLLCGDGRLPATKVGGVWMIAKRDIDQYRFGGRHG